MPTPAEVLLDASSLNSGTPWELLNSIDGSGINGFVLVDTVEVEFVNDTVDVELIDDIIDIELIDDAIDIELIDDTIDVEVG